MTAAMPDGTGLNEFKHTYPDRFVDVGIAEQHGVTMAAGMALSDIVPVFAVYSTFLQRAYDQILHDVCLQNLHVIFAIDRAGIVGQDGETHHGVFDIAYLKHIPNMTLLAPTDGKELELMLKWSVDECKGPVAIRYPRGKSNVLDQYKEILNNKTPNLEIIEPETLYESKTKQKNKITIIALGSMLEKALGSIELLEKQQYQVKVINPKVATPNKIKELSKLLDGDQNIITIEDGVIIGGFGEMVALENRSKKVLSMGFPREFVTAGTQDELFKVYGLTPKGIEEFVLTNFEKKKTLLEAINVR